MTVKSVVTCAGTGLACLAGLSAAMFINRAAKEAKKAGDDDCAYLIILGSRVDGSRPGEMLAMRCERAAQYLKAHPHTKAIATGGLFRKNQTVSEAAAIKKSLEGFGIDPQRILIENKSRTTYENIRNAAEIIEAVEHRSVINYITVGLLSSDFHLYRARKTAQLLGLNVRIIAANSPVSPVVSYTRECFVNFPATAAALVSIGKL